MTHYTLLLKYLESDAMWYNGWIQVLFNLWAHTVQPSFIQHTFTMYVAVSIVCEELSFTPKASPLIEHAYTGQRKDLTSNLGAYWLVLRAPTPVTKHHLPTSLGTDDKSGHIHSNPWNWTVNLIISKQEILHFACIISKGRTLWKFSWLLVIRILYYNITANLLGSEI